jgi:ribosomal protein S13
MTKSMLRFGNAVSGFFGGSDRFDEIYKEKVDKVLEESLAKVNEKNIDATLIIAKQNIDNYEKEKTLTDEMLQEIEDNVEDGPEKDQQISQGLQKIKTLEDQLKIYENYLTELEEKKKTFMFREAEAKR